MTWWSSAARCPSPRRSPTILDVIEGLQEAHRVGVIHRDVKPSNCFLDEDGRVKVGDFGLAKSLIGPDQLTQSGAFLGTLLFASPEQIRNDQRQPPDRRLLRLRHALFSADRQGAVRGRRHRRPPPRWRAPSATRCPPCASVAATCPPRSMRSCCAAWHARAASAGRAWRNCAWPCCPSPRERTPLARSAGESAPTCATRSCSCRWNSQYSTV